nr:UDP-3-O-(3-hydroxymyristoyl)glucosamine N-acyltransferase [Desulfobacterales bacterium]
MKQPLYRIAELIDGEIIGDPNIIITGVAGFDDARPGDITFCASPKYKKRIGETKASAIIVPRDIRSSSNVLVCVENPYLGLAKVLKLFYQVKRSVTGISPHVQIGHNFKHGVEVCIYPGVVIDDNVRLGDRVTIYPGVFIDKDVVIGDDTVIYSNVSILERTQIGSRVIIHAGTVIGSDGFGFAPDGERYEKIPQTGFVRVDDDVEIGAGNTIDRGTFGATWIKRGVKTDNMVHIAHNVVVGEDTILVAQVGIAGSVTIGSHSILAGQAGVADNITIGNNVIIGPQSGVARSIPDGQTVSGTPEMPHSTWLKTVSIIPKLPQVYRKIRELEKRIAVLEKERGKNGTGI